ncbi:hypothetical protein NDU88_002856 [Pleurodeles waltl]|uniref:Uncharacterized protein n=1 Tax=Pleurodeles waltl TaxID=8319 RepID=A0AAV7KTB2_PLEWA|nr:hypothetical protein NDU88_002856 [Pleurodeles waltl]
MAQATGPRKNRTLVPPVKANLRRAVFSSPGCSGASRCPEGAGGGCGAGQTPFPWRVESLGAGLERQLGPGMDPLRHSWPGLTVFSLRGTRDYTYAHTPLPTLLYLTLKGERAGSSAELREILVPEPRFRTCPVALTAGQRQRRDGD